MMKHVARGSTGVPGALHTWEAGPLCLPVGGGTSPVSRTGIPRGHPQALLGAAGYPQGAKSASITRRVTRNVDVDGPTRGPTKE